MYFYVYNLQGDVTHILDDDANIVGTYTYDAWGKITNLSSLTSIAQTNPFRYRGYYYDTESGLYYLNSRYYNPEWGRFLNADDVALLGVNGDFTSYNIFAYCGNNPIIRLDRGGDVWETVFDVVSLGFSIVEVATNPYDIGAWIGLVGDAIDLVPFVTGVGEVTRGIRFIDKAGNTLEIAKAVDFTDDAKKSIKKLENINGFTKSTKKDGINIHKGYKKGANFISDHKEYTKVTGIRPDYYDEITIFELKPFNPRSAKSGIKQLSRYNNILGGGKIMRLEFY